MPGPSPSEPDLLARIAEGDRQSFDALFHQYAPWLVARLRCRWADSAQIDDVVQETFLAVWRACAGGQQPDVQDMAGWLWRIASRRLVDTARAEGSRSRLHQALSRLRSRPPELSAEDRVLGGVEFSEAHGAVARLPPDLREVVQATVIDGLTTSQAAERLRIPPGTVKTRAMRARQRLRTDIEQARRQGG